MLPVRRRELHAPAFFFDLEIVKKQPRNASGTELQGPATAFGAPVERWCLESAAGQPSK
jgi:hypothetical protein